MFQFAKNLDSSDIADPRKFSRIFMACTGSYALVAGLLGVIGWLADIPSLTDWMGNGIAMFFNTCLLAVFAGAALLLLASGRKRAESIAAIIGGALTLAGGAILFQHLTGINLGIDTLIVADPWTSAAATSPGRPGPPSAVAYTLIGIALILVSRGPQARRLVPILGLGVAALSLLSLIGYVFQADMLFSLAQYTGIAFQSASIIFVLALGVLASVPEQEPVRALLRGTTASSFARRALPTIVLLPVFLVLLCYQGFVAGYFDVGMALSLLVLGLIAVTCALLWWSVAAVARYEASILTSAQRLRQLISLMPAAVYTCDHDGRITFFNRRAAELWGREPNIGDHSERFCGSYRIWRPDGTPLLHEESPVVAALKSGTSVREQEAVIERPDGTGIVVSANVDPLYDANGVCAGAINVFHDVTANKREEEKRRATEHQLRELIEGLPAAVYTTDAEGRVTMYNQASVEFSGRMPEIGTDQWCVSWKLYRPDGTPMAHDECPMAIALREGRPIRGCEAIAERPDGSRVHFIPYPTPMHDSQGNLIGAVNMLVDITERKEFEKRIEDTNNELKDLTAHLENRVQERTRQLEERSEQLRRLALQLAKAEENERKRIARILHDHLQQLLIAAKMQLQLARSTAGNENGVVKSQDFIQQAYDASRSLTSELRPPVLYEGGLVPALQFLARKFESQYGLVVRLSVLPDAEPNADPLKTIIYQSVQELLMNATKYAGTQACSLGMERLPNGEIRVSVRDRGTGFDADSVGKEGHGGFGLFNIRERINALGGSCKIESVAGQGSHVEIRIPDDPKQETNRDPAKHLREKKDKGRGKAGSFTVLVADDHKIVRQSLATLLGTQPFIHGVLESENGKAAIELAGETNPDIVLMDLNMPVMNGIEATKLLHQQNPDIKIIGLSVQAEPETAQAMKDAGAIMYFSKSEDLDSLIEALKELAYAS